MKKDWGNIELYLRDLFEQNYELALDWIKIGSQTDEKILSICFECPGVTPNLVPLYKILKEITEGDVCSMPAKGFDKAITYNSPFGLDVDWKNQRIDTKFIIIHDRCNTIAPTIKHVLTTRKIVLERLNDVRAFDFDFRLIFSMKIDETMSSGRRTLEWRYAPGRSFTEIPQEEYKAFRYFIAERIVGENSLKMLRRETLI